MIARIIEKCMTKENKHSIRMAGFELLLLLIEIFGSEADENVSNFLIPTFANALTLDPFLTESQKSKLTNRETFVLCPETTPPTAQESIEMWNFLLDFVTERVENFEFWYELLQKQYFVLFFKEEIAYLELTDESGLSFESCPNELQRVLSEKYNQWTDNPKIFSIVWNENNSMLMIGFNKQNVKMPIEYHKVVKHSLTFLRRVLLVRFFKINLLSISKNKE